CSLHHQPHADLSTPSLHDALPIYHRARLRAALSVRWPKERGKGHEDKQDLSCHRHRHSRKFRPVRQYITAATRWSATAALAVVRSEEHTSELQSRVDIVCRLLLEK